jgi:dephospho-CoA kinase
MHFRPPLRSILIRCAHPVMWYAGASAFFLFVRSWFSNPEHSTGFTPVDEYAATGCTIVVVALIARAGLKVVMETLECSARSYTLSPKDASSSRGFLHRTHATIPVASIEQITVDRSVGERLLGLGTVLLSSAGSQRIDVAWVNVSKAGMVAGKVREAMDRARPSPSFLDESAGHERAQPLVIGLVGGIGAGKSAVAAAFADLGCLVIDSDRDARAALDLPAVRDQLVRWWGASVIGADGKVDRKAVAEIVFSDPTQRARLEGVVHPLVKASRSEVIARASAEGRRGVIIDAPLLFEAKSDGVCDVVLFVDAPVEQRLARVKSRGWDAAELARRENAQLPLEEKRNRSHAIILNDSDVATLRARVKQAFDDQISRLRGSSGVR